MEIKDSGNRREFKTGAVRDVNDDKGRCDLLPLDVVAMCIGDSILDDINDYVRTGDTFQLVRAIQDFSYERWGDTITGILEVSKHYSEGAFKYEERNWEKGIPLHCYIDSGTRHYLKYKRGDKDEPHDRAFIWNMLGALWTHDNLPDCIDLPFKGITK
jgi:hypothetical protein